MATQRWVNLGLLLSAFAVFLFSNRLIETLWDLFRLPFGGEWAVPPWAVLSFLIAVTVAVILRQNNKTNVFFNEVVQELTRVTWPQRRETVMSAGVVAILVSVSATILFFIDSIWRTVIRGTLSL